MAGHLATANILAVARQHPLVTFSVFSVTRDLAVRVVSIVVNNPPAWAPPTAPACPASSPALELVVFLDDTVALHSLPALGALSIGRNAGNDIRINHASVSRFHACLHLGPELSLEGHSAVNGTFVRAPSAGREAEETQRSIGMSTVEIGVGDHLTFGSVMCVIRRRAVEARQPFHDEPSSVDLSSFEGIVVADPAMRAVYKEAHRAAKSPLTVLLLGETGVGKEVLARTIHLFSPRAAGPYQALNCSALPESLLEAELFGYKAGAFTGSTQSRTGLLESAEGGTFFLDEAGDLPMNTQVKLLRVLGERQIVRLGESTPRPIDVRFIAATNADLDAKIASGAFRQDLFHRLSGWPLTIPPLRERTADIAPLAEFFAAKACRDFRYPTPAVFSEETRALLERYTWSGNVRELGNVVERAVALSRGGEIRPDHLPARFVTGVAQRSNPPAAPSSRPTSITLPPPHLVKGSAEERAAIVGALETKSGNQGRAAELLGISRRTLIERLALYNLPRPRKKV